jgi:hypothetical protein
MASEHVIDDTRPAELSLDEEMAFFGEDDVFDRANLFPEDTGIEGVIFISTNVPRLPHGPRVKYFEKTGKGQRSFSVSIAAQPQLVASSLPDKVVRHMVPQVEDWVRLNREALLRFWSDGAYWSKREVTDFLDGLAKRSPR